MNRFDYYSIIHIKSITKKEIYDVANIPWLLNISICWNRYILCNILLRTRHNLHHLHVILDRIWFDDIPGKRRVLRLDAFYVLITQTCDIITRWELLIVCDFNFIIVSRNKKHDIYNRQNKVYNGSIKSAEACIYNMP